jgi:hypothetical protein
MMLLASSLKQTGIMLESFCWNLNLLVDHKPTKNCDASLHHYTPIIYSL